MHKRLLRVLGTYSLDMKGNMLAVGYVMHHEVNDGTVQVLRSLRREGRTAGAFGPRQMLAASALEEDTTGDGTAYLEDFTAYDNVCGVDTTLVGIGVEHHAEVLVHGIICGGQKA